MSEAKLKLLLVDDEQAVLDGLGRGLRGLFDLRMATSGEVGLDILSRENDVSIVLSDMRMPFMNGATFLGKVRTLAPDTVRLLLTGQADVEDAISAINEGNVFRFLRKPCEPGALRATLAAAVDQRRLIMAERLLLEQTLRGAVQALCDTLAFANPAVFGVATRVKRICLEVASRVGVQETWPLEVAAMVCQLGAMTVPPHVYERRTSRGLLQTSEQAMLDRVPQVTDQLLAPIPRLENVREIVRHSRDPGSRPSSDREFPLEGEILRIALEFDDLEVGGARPAAILERLRTRARPYHEAVLRALGELYARPAEVATVSLASLRNGMVIAADITTTTGMLIIARGHEVTPTLIGRLKNFAGSLPGPTVEVFTEEA